MHVSISGKQVEIGESLTTHTEQAIEHSVAKYFSHAIEARLVMSRERHMFHADLTVHAAHDVLVRSQGEADMATAAVDAAIEKAAKQLRRQKRKLTDHRHGKN